MIVVVVMIHLSLVCSGLVWVVDSGDCYLIVSLGWGVGWVVVFTLRLRLCVS